MVRIQIESELRRWQCRGWQRHLQRQDQRLEDGGREMLLSRHGLGLVTLCSGRRRDEWGRSHHSHSPATLMISGSSSRRIALLRLGLGFPLLHLANALAAGGAKATPCAHMVEEKPLEAGGTGARSPVEVFGFDGLGKASEEYVPGKIVALAQAGDGAVLFLGVDGFELPLQLVVGPAEAMAVLTAVQERKTRRPVTHEAWGLSLAAVGWKVDRVAITSNESDVFYSRVILSNSSETMKSIDVRPSDGIALALRCRAPLYVRRKVAQDILLGPDLEQADKRKLNPLKRPSLQANNKSGNISNYVTSLKSRPESQSGALLFIDEEVMELLGTSVKIFI